MELNTQNMTEQASLEELFAALDSVIQQLEGGNASLEEAFGAYQKGMELLKDCSKKIDTVEKEMLLLNENGDLSEF